jgi:hypothetical protein
VLLEQRVAEHLGEVAHQPPVLVGGEGAQVDVERAREAQQQLRGERPAVVLDEVEVARRHAEPLRERGLRQPGARAHGAHAGAVARGRRGGEARAPVARGAVGRGVGCLRPPRARHPRNASGRALVGRAGRASGPWAPRRRRLGRGRERWPPARRHRPAIYSRDQLTVGRRARVDNATRCGAASCCIQARNL